MKRTVLAFLASFMMLVVISPSEVFAIDMSGGVYTWYAWWDFPEDTYDKINADPDFVYGPSLSVNLADSLSLTTVFLYGKFNADGKDGYFHAQNPLNPVLSVTYDIDRYDSDTALNLTLNKYLKLYVGFKYTVFSYDLTSVSAGYPYTAEFDHKAMGPAAGLSVAVPLAQGFSVVANGGGLYLWGKEKFSDSFDESSNSNINDYGFNTGLALVYFIEPLSTAVSLGGRYQYLKIKYDDGFSNTSRFYGITLSASYLFSL